MSRNPTGEERDACWGECSHWWPANGKYILRTVLLTLKSKLHLVVSFFFFSFLLSARHFFFLICHEDFTTFPPLAHEDVSYVLCRDMSFNRKPRFCFSCASSAVCFLTPHSSCLLPKWLKGIPPSFCFANDTPLGFWPCNVTAGKRSVEHKSVFIF